MKRLAPQSAAAIVVVALLAFVAILTSHAEVPGDDSYASTDYRSGGYRAWAALLAGEHITTSRFVLRPIELDDRIDTLISAQPLPGATDAAARTAADLAALASWVRGGGRLVYIGRNAAIRDAESRLLGLPFFLPDVGPRSGQSGPLAARAGSGLTELGTNRMLLVEHTGRSELWDGNGDIVVRYPLGRGEILAVVDSVPFTNAGIVAPGNARIAYLLGVPRKPGGSVAFDDGVHGALIDRPWYRALPIPVRVSLGILALAALLALTASVLHGGPPVRLRAAREPTSVEFVRALAALHERIHARSEAGAILGHDVLGVVARGLGVSDRTAPAELADRLGEDPRAGDVRRLAERLAAPIATDADLLASAKLAQAVRKEWTYGGYRDRRRTAFAGRSRARRRR